MRGIIIGTVAMVCGCSALTGLDGLERATTCDGPCDEGAGDATTSVDGAAMSDGGSGTDSTVSDGMSDSAVDAGACAAFTSPPKMVPAGGICIDSTEVRKGDYALFLSAVVKPPAPAECSWNFSYTPTGGWPPATPADERYPVAHVDWCDAYVYCAWAGKRLCGDAEWNLSCSANGANTFPYGNGFKSNACNGASAGLDGSAPVGSFPDCVGGYPGIFDMSGNVLEWGDSCADGGLPQNDTCAASGGDFSDTTGNLACASNDPHVRNGKQRNLGFRCCATP